MKKKLMFLLLLLACVTMLPLTVQKAQADDYYVYEEGVEGDWKFRKQDGHVYISGYTGPDTEIVIPDKIAGDNVTSIDYEAFEDNKQITKVSIPDGIEYIGTEAFKGCSSLHSVEIPESVNDIYSNAFEGTPWLDKLKEENNLVIINNILISIGNDVEDLSIPEGITLAWGLFEGEKNITSIYVPDSMKNLFGEWWRFSGCESLKTINFPEGAGQLGPCAFDRCGFEEIVLPSGTFAGNMTFAHCERLKKVTMPLKPLNTYTAAWDAFSSCTSLEEVVITAGEQMDESFFNDCPKLTKVVIPDTVKYIGAQAFNNCESLKGIIIPSSVTEIGSRAFGYLYEDEDGNEVKVPGFTIYGTKGTEAERYAKENGFRFVEAGTLDDATDASANVGNGSLYENVDDLNDKVLNDEERKALKDGNVVTVYITINDADSTVSTEDKSMVEDGLKNSVLGMYLNINLFSKVGNNEARQVTDTNGAVKIKFTVPDKLLNKDKSIERTYQIVRIHNGKRTVIDVTFNNKDNTISFESDKFSTYALVYTDKKAGAPDTGDVNVLTVLAALLAVSAGTVTLGLIKKKVTA